MDIILALGLTFAVVFVGGFLYMQVFRKRKFDAYAFVFIRREGGTEVVISRANILKTKEVKEPFLMLIDLKKDIAPLPTGLSMRYKNKPAFFFVRKSHETYTPVERMGKIKLMLESANGATEEVSGNPVKKLIFDWLKKKEIILKPSYAIYEYLVPPEKTPIVTGKENKKVVSLWTFVPSLQFDEREAWIQTRRALSELYSRHEWLKKMLPYVGIGIIFLVAVILFWQMGTIAEKLAQVVNVLQQLVKWTVAHSNPGAGGKPF